MRQFVVDAFTDTVFKGNPAAICVLEQWPSEELMQDIAVENNLSETAFAVRADDGVYDLRWFTPGGEIDLCGHATMATSYAILNLVEKGADLVRYRTRSGPLSVRRVNGRYELDMPAYTLKQIPVTDEMERAIGIRPDEAWLGRDLVLVFDDERKVIDADPDIEAVKRLDGLVQHLTAPGTEHDIVTRSFAPKVRVPEDPVCGSGHCHVAPYWARRLGKTELDALQASRRTGRLRCRVEGDRVVLGGDAALFSIAEIYLPGEPNPALRRGPRRW